MRDETFPGSNDILPGGSDQRTVAGIGPGRWDKGELARAQEAHAAIESRNPSVVYRLYTEDKPNVRELVSRYFDGATILFARGLWQGQTEDSVVIEIVALKSDLQKVVHLAGDIREVNQQTAVFMTYQTVKSLLIERP